MGQLEFHCFVHGFPEPSVAGPIVTVGDRQATTVKCAPPLPALPLTFDHVAQQLLAIDGLHFEPDGWFVWGCGAGAERWQVDGQLTDGGRKLEFVELRGRCPPSALETLLTAFTGDNEAVLFQLIAEGVFVDRDTFLVISEK